MFATRCEFVRQSGGAIGRAPPSLFLFVVLINFLLLNAQNFAMSILFHASMRAAIERSMAERTDWTTSRDDKRYRARKFMGFGLSEEKRDGILFIHIDLWLLAALHHDLQGSNDEEKNIFQLIIIELHLTNLKLISRRLREIRGHAHRGWRFPATRFCTQNLAFGNHGEEAIQRQRQAIEMLFLHPHDGGATRTQSKKAEAPLTGLTDRISAQ